MLPGSNVPDMIRRGLGLAARGAGDWCDLYRPAGPANPLDAGNRVLRMPAAFVALDNPAAPVSYGTATWQGIFDAAYAQPGDYLVGAEGVFFIAAITRLGPVICVRANRTVTLSRPAAKSAAGLSRYGGVVPAQTVALMTSWPASVLTRPREGGRGALPADAPGLPGGPGGWEVLVPGTPGVLLRPGDLIRDDLGRTAVLAGTELTQLGWRLLARQAGT
jgi:hypothetical protein